MHSKTVCIAGGSGAGKTTLANALAERLGGAEKVAVVHLDDFQKPKEAVPMTASLRRNYDHPSAVDWDAFVAAVRSLKSGKEVLIPKRTKTRSMESGVASAGYVSVLPKEIILIEGYLALYAVEARVLYDISIFLRASRETRVARRLWVKDAQYVNEVLLPMHDAFIEPTAVHAGLILDIDGLSPEEVCAFAEGHIACMSFPERVYER